MKFLDWTKGYKTYLTIGAGLGLGVYQYFTGHDVPNYIYFGLGLVGLGFHRSALSDQTLLVAEDLGKLVNNVLTQVTVTTTDPSSATAKSAVALGNEIPVTSKVEVVVGKPSPTTVPETAVTDALNEAQLTPHNTIQVTPVK